MDILKTSGEKVHKEFQGRDPLLGNLFISSFIIATGLQVCVTMCVPHDSKTIEQLWGTSSNPNPFLYRDSDLPLSLPSPHIHHTLLY